MNKTNKFIEQLNKEKENFLKDQQLIQRFEWDVECSILDIDTLSLNFREAILGAFNLNNSNIPLDSFNKEIPLDSNILINFGLILKDVEEAEVEFKITNKLVIDLSELTEIEEYLVEVIKRIGTHAPFLEINSIFIVYKILSKDNIINKETYYEIVNTMNLTLLK